MVPTPRVALAKLRGTLGNAVLEKFQPAKRATANANLTSILAYTLTNPLSVARFTGFNNFAFAILGFRSQSLARP